MGGEMGKKSQWVTRQMQCPEGERREELLLEWKVEKGRKVLQSISCGNRQLLDYSGADCQWFCLEKISRKKG